MKRRWRVLWLAVGTLVSLGLLLVLLVVAGEAGPAVAWRGELDRYVSYEEAHGSGPLRVQAVSRATRPLEFTQDMAGVTYGESVGYQTDYTYSGRAPGSRPVLYPPADVWCVALVGASPTGQTEQRVVFVARHEDLYTAAWLVHSGARAPFSPAFLAGLARIGCDLKLPS